LCESPPAQVLASVVLCGPGPAAVKPLVAGFRLIHSHPGPAPGTRDSPGSGGSGMAGRPGGCRPSWSISLFSVQRNTGTSSFSPSLALPGAAVLVQNLPVHGENENSGTHFLSPHYRGRNLFSPWGEG